jgi:predicted nucleic acid-binding protein
VPPYFADTAFWLALSNRRDPYHGRAAAWNAFTLRTATRIVTTEAVLWEWLNALSHASTRGFAAEGYRRVHQDARIDVVDFGPLRVDSAVQLYAGRLDKSWSITDCLSFVVMRQFALSHALTTDHHFEQAGFVAAMLDVP